MFQIYKFIEFSMICQGIAQKNSLIGKRAEGRETAEIAGKKCGVWRPVATYLHHGLLHTPQDQFVRL
jgi:hypothetical protein